MYWEKLLFRGRILQVHLDEKYKNAFTLEQHRNKLLLELSGRVHRAVSNFILQTTHLRIMLFTERYYFQFNQSSVISHQKKCFLFILIIKGNNHLGASEEIPMEYVVEYEYVYL